MGNGREGLAGIVREVMGHPDNDGLMAELKSMHGKMAEMSKRPNLGPGQIWLR